MANIKVMIDGKEYTKEQFRKDTIRMFDTLRKRNSERMGSRRCKDVECRDCPLTICIESTDDMESRYFACFKDVHEWALKHPAVTNRDKMIETFGGAYFNLIINYISDRSLEDYDTWLNEEYKKPNKEKNKNDD